MANGHVEIHDPMSNHDDGRASRTDGESDSDQEGTVEFRLMMAYAKRRRPEKDLKSPAARSPGGPAGDSQEMSSPQTPASTDEETPTKKKKKRTGGKRLLGLFSCIKPAPAEPQETPEAPHTRCALIDKQDDHQDDVVREKDELDVAASRLARIADEISFLPPELEADSNEGDANVEKMIALLLRETGDSLNERQELQDALRDTQLFWSYSFFERLIKTLLRRMGLWTSDPEAPGPQVSPQTQIAVTCEVTSRLSAADTLPMNRLLGYGAAYLQNHFSSWAKQQGGYEAAFDDGDDDEEEDDVQ